MNVFKQLGLLLKQNLLERRRRPIVSLLEVIWPLLVVAVFVVVRKEISGPLVDDCDHKPRALPSAGTMVFIQSLFCSLNGRYCAPDSQTLSKRSLANHTNAFNSSQSKLPTLLAKFQQLITENFQVVLALPDLLSESLNLLSQFGTIMSSSKNLQEFLAIDLSVKAFLKDGDAVIEMFESIGFSNDFARTLLNSTVDLSSLDSLLLSDGVAYLDFCNIGRNLLIPPDSKSSLLSRTMCSMNATQAASFAVLLQSQLNIDAIVKMVADMANAFGEPDVSTSVLYLYKAVKELSSNDTIMTFKGLQRHFSDYRDIFFTIYQIVTTTDEGSKLALLSTVGAMDAVVRSLDTVLVNSSAWTDFSSLWALGKMLYKSITTPAMRYNVTMPFTATFSDPAEFTRLLQQAYNVGDDFIYNLRVSEAIVYKVIDHLSLLAASNASRDSCLLTASFWSVFTFRWNSTVREYMQASISSIVETACASGKADQFTMNRTLFNLEVLLNKINADFSDGTASQITQQILTISNAIMNFYAQNEPLLQALRVLDYGSIWQTMKQLVTTGYIGAPSSAGQISAVLEAIQGYLRSTPHWDIIQQQLGLTDRYLDIFLSLLNGTQDIFSFLQGRFLTEPVAESQVNATKALSNAIGKDVEMLTTWEVLQSMYNSTNATLEWQEKLCRIVKSNLTIELSYLSTEAITSIVCERNFSSFQQRIRATKYLEPLRSRIDGLVSTFKALSSPYTSRPPKVVDIVVKAYQAVDLLLRFRNNSEWFSLSTGLHPATLLLHYTDVIAPELIASAILGEVSVLAEQISYQMLVKFAQLQLDGERNISGFIASLSTDLTQTFEQLSVTNNSSLVWFMTTIGRATQNVSHHWLSEEISKNFVDIINNLPTSADNLAFTRATSFLSDTNITEYLRHGTALSVAVEHTLTGLIFWAFKMSADLSGKESVAAAAVTVHQYLSRPRSPSDFSSSAELIIDAFQSAVVHLKYAAEVDGNQSATSIWLQSLLSERASVESSLQMLLSVTWSYEAVWNATSAFASVAYTGNSYAAGVSVAKVCGFVIAEVVANFAHGSLAEIRPVSQLIATGALEIAEIAGFGQLGNFIGHLIYSVINDTDGIYQKAANSSFSGSETPTNALCGNFLQEAWKRSIYYKDTTCSSTDCDWLQPLSSAFRQLSAIIFSIIGSMDNRCWSSGKFSAKDCAAFSRTVLNILYRHANATVWIRTLDSRWLTVTDMFDIIVSVMSSLSEFLSIARSFTRFWMLLPDDEKVNALLFQFERYLTPPSSEYSYTINALCLMANALNYTSTKGHRDTLKQFFCEGNTSNFLTEIGIRLDIQTVVDKVGQLRRNWKTTKSLSEFNFVQFYEKIVDLYDQVPIVISSMIAYWTTLQDLSKLTDQNVGQRLLGKFSDRLSQLLATFWQQGLEMISNEHFTTDYAGTTIPKRMRRSDSLSAITNYARNTTFNFGQVVLPSEASVKWHEISLDETCSAVLDVALQVGLPNQVLPSSFAKLQYGLDGVTYSLSILASLLEMAGHILQADLTGLTKVAKDFEMSKFVALLLNQESSEAKPSSDILPPSDICRSFTDQANKATESFSRMVTTIRSYSSLDDTKLKLSLNSSFVYIESIVDAAVSADSLMRAVRVAAGSSDLQLLISPVLKVIIDYVIAPSNYAKLSSLIVHSNFSATFNAFAEDQNFSEILDFAINVDAMIILLSSNADFVDKTICKSTTAAQSLFAAGEVNTTVFINTLCSTNGSLTPSSLVRSLNVSLLGQLESKRPLSVVLSNMVAVGMSFINVLDNTGLARLSEMEDAYSRLVYLLQQVALPPMNAKVINLSQLALSFKEGFDVITAYTNDGNLTSLSNLIDNIIQALTGFVALQEKFKVSVQVKDIFGSKSTVLATLFASKKRSVEPLESLLDQHIDLNPLLSLSNISAIEEYVCSPAGLFSELHLDSSKTTVPAENIRRTICEQDPAIAADIARSIKQALSPQSLSSKILTTLPERLLGSDGDRFLNETKSLHPMYQFFSKASNTVSDFKETFNVPTSALGVVEPVSGNVFVFPEHIRALSSAFCGYPIDTNSLLPAGSYISGRKRSVDDDYAEFLSLPSEVCQALMLTIRQQQYGKVIWAFMKPFLSGKILYTPSNNFTDYVMLKANRTFVEASQIVEFFKSFREGLLKSALSDDAVQELTSKTLDQKALKNPLVQKVLNKAFSFDQNSIRQLLQLVNKDDSSTATLLKLSSIIIQASACISFNRFEKVQTEEDLVTRAKVLSRNNSFLAGVVFLDSAESGKRDVRYKIRMNRDNVPSTFALREQVYMPAPLDDYLGNLKYLQGFVQLQDMIDQAIMDVFLNSTVPTARPVAEIRQMPAPCFYDDPFRGIMYPYILLIIVASGYLFSVAHSIKTLVYYREEGLDEVLKLVGVRACTIWIAWFMNNYVFMLLISSILTVMVVYFNIVPLTDPLIIFLYLAVFSFSVLSFSYLISAMFTKANMAATLGVMVYFLFMLPYAASVTWSNTITQRQQMAISLFAPSAFAFGAEQISRWEQLGVGLQWSNMAKGVSANDSSLSHAWTCIWMLIDSVIYFFVGWYFVNVLPTKYGAPRQWYFLFTPSFWKPEACTARKQDSKSYTLPALAEDEFYHFVVGISTQGLSKSYKCRRAVTDLSVDFYEGQVTAFLGKNGAGKTTTIHMLTGIRKPTSGSAYVNGMDISQNMAKIRLTLGFCPQFDILFDYMTVKEHLDYFAELKGDRKKLTASSLLIDMGLEHVADELVGKISGGLRRRLSVALAFCGDSKTIILDEPTSSIDPNGRRAIWDVILKYRSNRTIVLCTHHLDEAELISDRVAIMKEGKLLCTGSPMALKRQHSEGHKLLIEIVEPLQGPSNQSNPNFTSAVIDFVKSFMPSADVVASSSNTKLAFTLPLEDRQNYGQLCRALDEQLVNSGIKNYAITDCTLEQVFLAVTGENTGQIENEDPSERTGCLSFLVSKRAAPVSETSNHGLSSSQAQQSQSREVTSATSAAHCHDAQLHCATSSIASFSPITTKSGIIRFGMHLRALFMKRLIHNARNWKSYVSLLVLPCAFVGMAAMVSVITPDENNRPDLVLRLALYPASYIFFRDTSAGQEMSEALLKNDWNDLPCLNGPQNSSSCNLISTAKYSMCPAVPDALPVCSCFGTRGRTQQGQCDSRPPRVDEWQINDNSVLHRVCDAYNLDSYLYSTSLVSQYKGRRIGGWTTRDVDDANSGGAITTTWFDNRAYHSMPVLLSAINNAVLRSSGSGTLRNASITVSSHPITLSSASLDLATVLRSVADAGLALFLLVAASFLPAGLLPFMVNERLAGERRQQELCGLRTGTYWLVAVVWDLFVFALSALLILGMVAAFGIRSYVARDNAAAFIVLLLLYGWAALPVAYTFSRLFNSTVTAFFGTLLFNIFVGTLLTTTFLLLHFVPADILKPETVNTAANASLAFPQYALTSGFTKMAINQLQADILEPFGIKSYATPLVFLKWNFTALVVEGLFFLIVALVIESWHSPCRLPMWLRPWSSKPSCEAYDSRRNPVTADGDDVIAEKERALHCDASSQAVVLREVSKHFWGLNRTRVVVDSLSFAVSTGECFGMLGVNGAGKTTTFKMMTGALPSSNGDIYILGKKVTLASSSRPVIGYCPQENALDGKLTGREMLQFYGDLRGIPSDGLNMEINRLIDAFRMTKFVDRRTETYSGGMKRTLSVALAMLGRPSLVFLDEPTAGMDPHARQVVWQQVRAYVATGGSVILTSHSMNECDQLCDRLAIMVNGRFACIGSPQHLKNRYADGHTVMLKVKGMRMTLSAVTAYVEEQLNGAKLVDSHGGVLEFFVPFSAAKLGDLYLFVERYRQQLDVADYTIAQTTLDQVFIRFARMQSFSSTSLEATNEDSEEN